MAERDQHRPLARRRRRKSSTPLMPAKPLIGMTRQEPSRAHVLASAAYVIHIQSKAAPSPIASTIGGVPASKRCGGVVVGDAGRRPSPPRSSRRRPGNGRMPGPAAILLAVQHADARRPVQLVAGHHVPVDAIEVLHVHRACARRPVLPSTSTGMPRSCAILHDFLHIPVTVPSTFDICVMATSFVCGPSWQASSFSRSNAPRRRSTGATQTQLRRPAARAGSATARCSSDAPSSTGRSRRLA
jgi:hypothetical protein